jgi:hypothetical protein
MIEYRNSNGSCIEMAANGRLMPAQHEVNLRTLGCPDWLATRIENDRIERRARAAMAKGTEPAKPMPSMSDLKARASQIAQQIADDDKRFREQEELKQRLRNAAGIMTRIA